MPNRLFAGLRRLTTTGSASQGSSSNKASRAADTAGPVTRKERNDDLEHRSTQGSPSAVPRMRAHLHRG
jgi:hypothetical protein